MDCIFCKIAHKQLPAQIAYEDEHVLAFADLHPRAPTHQLIIPKKHIATLNDLTEEDLPLAGHLLWVARQLAKQLGIAEAGYRIVNNCNAGGGQVVFHLHVHLLGGRPMDWPPG